MSRESKHIMLPCKYPNIDGIEDEAADEIVRSTEMIHISLLNL